MINNRIPSSDEKELVRDFWNRASCGENLYLPTEDKDEYFAQRRERYRLEPFIPTFAEFDAWEGKKVLEVGVGLGADHQGFAEGGAILSGIDLTDRAVLHTKKRFEQLGLHSNLLVGDAEKLPFLDDTFDMVYSWGVLHHSPNTQAAFDEVFRVLKPGGKLVSMIYHKYSIVGYMLWIRYALASFRPWTSLNEIYSKHLESPGTKAYSFAEAKELLCRFEEIALDSCLSHGDLLTSEVGQRHRGFALSIARKLIPRTAIKFFFPKHGLPLFIKARKPF